MDSSPIFPIEQRVTWPSAGAPLALARDARAWLPVKPETRYEVSEAGLRMLGQSEGDLVEPREILQALYGERVRFAPVQVRLIFAGGWFQPIMGFRIEADAAYLSPVTRALEQRAARVSDIEWRPRRSILRGEAPLSGLIGYPCSLKRLSGGTAHATLWLSHYEPIWAYSPETMACYAE